MEVQKVTEKNGFFYVVVATVVAAVVRLDVEMSLKTNWRRF